MSATPNLKRQTTSAKNPKTNDRIASIELIMLEKELGELTLKIEELMQRKEEILSKNNTKCSYIC